MNGYDLVTLTIRVQAPARSPDETVFPAYAWRPAAQFAATTARLPRHFYDNAVPSELNVLGIERDKRRTSALVEAKVIAR